MRVQLETEGGLAYLPGLSKPITVNTEDLPKDEAEELKRLVHAARFFDLPATVNEPPEGAADYQQYTITVEDGEKRHTVSFTDPINNPSLQALHNFIRAKAKK